MSLDLSYLNDYLNSGGRRPARISQLNQDRRRRLASQTRSRIGNQYGGLSQALARGESTRLGRPALPAGTPGGPSMGSIPMPSGTIIDPPAQRISMMSGPLPANASASALPPMPAMAPVVGEGIQPMPGITPSATPGGQGFNNLPAQPPMQNLSAPIAGRSLPMPGITPGAMPPGAAGFNNLPPRPPMSPIPNIGAPSAGAAAAGAGSPPPAGGAGAAGAARPSLAFRAGQATSRLGGLARAGQPNGVRGNIGRASGALLAGQLASPLLQQVPGEIGGVDIGDRLGRGAQMAGYGAAIGSFIPGVGTATGGILGGAAGLLGLGEGEAPMNEQDARERAGQLSSSLSTENQALVNQMYDLYLAQGADPQQALASTAEYIMALQQQDAASRNRRNDVLAQQAIIAGFMNPAMNDARSGALGRTAAGRSYIGAMAGQTHAIPLVNDILAEQERQAAGLGSSGSAGLDDLINSLTT